MVYTIELIKARERAAIISSQRWADALHACGLGVMLCAVVAVSWLFVVFAFALSGGR